MHLPDIGPLRLQSQHIPQADFTSAEDAVAWMGAMQAQDYPGALWAIGLRTRSLLQADIEQAIKDKRIIRTWPMRGTLHFVAAQDVRWMVMLLAPRATAAAAGRRKALEIDATVIAKSRAILESALAEGNCLTRTALCALLDEAGVATTGQRGIHLLRYFSELGLLCFGPHEGKQPTFVLMDEWLKPVKVLSRDESLAELTKRYFKSHGPATIRDFSGWSNLTLRDARLGLRLAGDQLASETIAGTVYWFGLHAVQPKIPAATYLLPGFDEFMLGYKDRSATLSPLHSQKIVPGNNGMFLPTIVSSGHVAGTWKRVVRKSGVNLLLSPFDSLSSSAEQQIEAAAQRYSDFMQLSVQVTLA